MPGMPPHEYWEKPAAVGRIPANRTDSGVWLTAEVLGAKSCILVRDEDGLYTTNPKSDPSGTFIPKSHAQELLDMDTPDLIIEPIVVDSLLHAKCPGSIQIINGMVPGNITRGLNGEHVGTIIYAAPALRQLLSTVRR